MSEEAYEYVNSLASLMKSDTDVKHKKVRDISNELSKLGVDDQLVLQANNIYWTMSKGNNKGLIIRANNRNRLLFFCLFYAYYELGIKEEPFTLARRFGFNLKIVKEAFKNFSSPIYGYRPPIIINTISDLIPSMTKYFNIHPTYTKVLDMIAKEVDNSGMRIIKPQRWVMTLIYICSQVCSAKLNIPNDVDVACWCQDIGIKYSSVKNNVRELYNNTKLTKRIINIIDRCLII